MQRAAVHMPVPFYVRYARKAVLPCLHGQTFAGQRTVSSVSCELFAIRPESGAAVLARAAAIKNTDPSVFCPLKNEHTCL